MPFAFCIAMLLKFDVEFNQKDALNEQTKYKIKRTPKNNVIFKTRNIEISQIQPKRRLVIDLYLEFSRSRYLV